MQPRQQLFGREEFPALGGAGQQQAQPQQQHPSLLQHHAPLHQQPVVIGGGRPMQQQQGLQPQQLLRHSQMMGGGIVQQQQQLQSQQQVQQQQQQQMGMHQQQQQQLIPDMDFMQRFQQQQQMAAMQAQHAQHLQQQQQQVRFSSDDFPALGGSGGDGSSANPSDKLRATPAFSSIVNANLMQQQFGQGPNATGNPFGAQQQQQQQQQRPPSPSAFPPLGMNASSAASRSATSLAGKGPQQQQQQMQQPQAMSLQVPQMGAGGQTLATSGGSMTMGMSMQGDHATVMSPLDQQQSFMAAAQQAPPSPMGADRFGLMGLLGVIRMTDQDLNTLALGCDLTTLGLNLNAAEPLHTTFISPWADQPTDVNNFQLPECYTVPQTGEPQQKMNMFSDETLFYIFYAMPRDELQDRAAQELYNRNWRYHKDLQVWLTKDPSANELAYVKTPTYEKGSYVFFDVSTWSKTAKEFVLYYEQLEERAAQGGQTAAPLLAAFESDATESSHSAAVAQA